MTSHPRFTLTRSEWYAMEYLHGHPNQELFEHYSPIFLFEFVPRGSGNGRIDIEFWHLNYPSGVNRKVYRLRVLQRSYGYLIALRIDIDEEPSWAYPTLILKPNTEEWLRKHNLGTMEMLEREGRLLSKQKPSIGRP